jgi:hypothetical protein
MASINKGRIVITAASASAVGVGEGLTLDLDDVKVGDYDAFVCRAA